MEQVNLEELKAKYDIMDYKEDAVKVPEKPESGLVLVIGSSGSGKTTILRNWFEKQECFFNSNSVIENFSSISKGDKLLRAFGLKSIPTWFRPADTLSNGEYHRAICALRLDKGINYIDEFTSTVDRDTAKSLSVALRKYYKSGLLVVATCHRDIEEWLQPDIVYDADAQEYRLRGHFVDLSLKSKSEPVQSKIGFTSKSIII